MVELFEGRLGGGKTYSAVVRIVDQLRRGGLVCTNIDLVWEAIADYIATKFQLVVSRDQLIVLDEEQIGLFHRHTPTGSLELSVLVVIDEAHLTFNARDYSKTDKLYRETLTFLTQSRKVHTDVIFISQSILNMDKQFMRLVQYIWRFRDLSRWKIPGLGIKYPFKQILAVQFDYDGHTILQRSFLKQDRRIFALYRTNALLREFPRLENKQTSFKLEKHQPSKKQMAKVLIPIGVIVGIFAAYILYHNFKGGTATAFSPNKVTTTTSTISSLNPTSSLLPVKSAEKHTAYDIYSEVFQSWNGNEHALKTVESGWYQLGEMSSKGFVTAVSDRRAKIEQPDGRIGWVVATANPPTSFGNSVNTTPSPAPTVSPRPSPIIAQMPEFQSTPPELFRLPPTNGSSSGSGASSSTQLFNQPSLSPTPYIPLTLHNGRILQPQP